MSYFPTQNPWSTSLCPLIISIMGDNLSVSRFSWIRSAQHNLDQQLKEKCNLKCNCTFVVTVSHLKRRPATPIQRIRAMMSSIWYPGCTKSPAMARRDENENTLIPLMLKGMRAPIMRAPRTIPVTRVTTFAARCRNIKLVFLSFKMTFRMCLMSYQSVWKWAAALAGWFIIIESLLLLKPVKSTIESI